MKPTIVVYVIERKEAQAGFATTSTFDISSRTVVREHLTLDFIIARTAFSRTIDPALFIEKPTMPSSIPPLLNPVLLDFLTGSRFVASTSALDVSALAGAVESRRADTSRPRIESSLTGGTVHASNVSSNVVRSKNEKVQTY
jgi:hypothetical protein